MLSTQQKLCSPRQSGYRVAPFVSSRCRRACVVVRASADEDAELEARLAKLRAAKGATPYGQGSKSGKVQAVKTEEKKSAPPSSTASTSKPSYDYSTEQVYYEGPPHRGDLALNAALGTTLVWLPLTFAALGRCAFVNYRFTDMRLSIVTDAPWKKEQLDAAYAEVKNVITVGRGFGFWGDMVVELKDGSKVEIRSLDRYKELSKYILDRRDALVGSSTDLTQAQLLGDAPMPEARAKAGKGFQ